MTRRLTRMVVINSLPPSRRSAPLTLLIAFVMIAPAVAELRGLTPEEVALRAALTPEAQAAVRKSWAAAREAVEKSKPAFAPVGFELCRRWDRRVEPKECRPGPQSIHYLGELSGSFIVEVHCDVARPDGTRMEVAMPVQGRLSKDTSGLWTAWKAPVLPIDGASGSAEPIFEDDQAPVDEPADHPTSYVPPGPTGFLNWALYWFLVLVMPWLPEIIGITTFLTFLIVIGSRRSWKRLGLGGGVEALNVFTGMVIGFFMGLVIWHALPDEVRYGGVQGSTPLWLYLFLPAPLTAFGAIATHFGLGRLWARGGGLGAAPRIAIVGAQALFCLAVLRVIIICVHL